MKRIYKLSTAILAGQDWRMVNQETVMDRCGLCLYHTSVFDTQFTLHNKPTKTIHLGQVVAENQHIKLYKFMRQFNIVKQEEEFVIEFKLSDWYRIRLEKCTNVEILVTNQVTGQQVSVTKPYAIFKPSWVDHKVRIATIPIPAGQRRLSGIARMADVVHKLCVNKATLAITFTFS